MPAADFRDHVMPAIVPADAGFPIHQSPGSARRAMGFPCVPVGLQGDEKFWSVRPLANLRFADVVRAAGRRRGESGIGKLDTVDLAGDFFAVPILVEDGGGSFQVDSFHLCRGQRLAMAVRVDDYE